MLPSKCGGFGGVNEAKPGGWEVGRGGPGGDAPVSVVWLQMCYSN